MKIMIAVLLMMIMVSTNTIVDAIQQAPTNIDDAVQQALTDIDDAMSHIYPLSGIIVAVIPDNDIIVIQDYNGNMWEWSGIEDWYEGDIAAMIMYDNNTESIYDDVIIDIAYNGWIQ